MTCPWFLFNRHRFFNSASRFSALLVQQLPLFALITLFRTCLDPLTLGIGNGQEVLTCKLGPHLQTGFYNLQQLALSSTGDTLAYDGLRRPDRFPRRFSKQCHSHRSLGNVPCQNQVAALRIVVDVVGKQSTTRGTCTPSARTHCVRSLADCSLSTSEVWDSIMMIDAVRDFSSCPISTKPSACSWPRMPRAPKSQLQPCTILKARSL
ncbi:hypothetical protein P153DRAFT_111621 [Dothidotthia symphoricarpi CBS 119687]|uniref:Uncharacterized protein n=1 Tax=Dothidotthia symphoricarpi CBS 119687 TaxID=1392245 RepID=A0A6A6A2B9_9PLEO|nr:uncharacterized protein P153DRAFT_111621 [Dothidotthia symphoricarpi CBS 119687]KAF2125345.1 hypothetical protein P153DRAFT_111621 [Dothidotthia symphoricarpi CBS 119687]